MKKLIISIGVVALTVIALTAYLFTAAVPKNAVPSSYAVYVFDDGAAQINVDSINSIMQLHEDKELDGAELKAGTLIVPGDGSEIYYDYTRRDKVTKGR